jgi:hypothetical protein
MVGSSSSVGSGAAIRLTCRRSTGPAGTLGVQCAAEARIVRLALHHVARLVDELTDACEHDCAPFIDDARARESRPRPIARITTVMHERITYLR